MLLNVISLTTNQLISPLAIAKQKEAHKYTSSQVSQPASLEKTAVTSLHTFPRGSDYLLTSIPWVWSPSRSGLWLWENQPAAYYWISKCINAQEMKKTDKVINASSYQSFSQCRPAQNIKLSFLVEPPHRAEHTTRAVLFHMYHSSYKWCQMLQRWTFPYQLLVSLNCL